MNYGGVEIVCPACRSDLEQDAAQLRCLHCRRTYPVIAGIADLRLYPDPYIDIEADRQKALRVAEKLEQLRFSELVDYYYGMTSVVPPQHARQYKNGLLAAVDRSEASLSVWHAASGTGKAEFLLDVGCGTAPLLAAAAPHAKRLAGVDVAFRWLMVGKKRLLEAGLEIPLFCACAEALPFAGEQFDRVILDSSVEHFSDQQKGLSECNRVMVPSGRLFLSTPNRFSLGPDPHMGLPAAGYLPKRLQDRYAISQGAIPPKRNLLWTRTLTGLIQGAGFTTPRLLLPRISDSQRAGAGNVLKRLVDLYRAAQSFPASRQMLFLVGPSLLAVTQKPSAGEQSRP